jgi:hypothetical protein
MPYHRRLAVPCAETENLIEDEQRYHAQEAIAVGATAAEIVPDGAQRPLSSPSLASSLSHSYSE